MKKIKMAAILDIQIVTMSNLRFEVAHKPLPLPRFGLIKHGVGGNVVLRIS